MSRSTSPSSPGDGSQATLFAGDTGYIESWDEYLLDISVTVSRKSKDPRCRVGAVLARDRRVLSTGFNGFARGVYDDDATLRDVATKLKLICHAEANAIDNAAFEGVALAGATIYVTKFPCLACCNRIVQVGVTRLYTHDKRYWDDDPLDGDHRLKPVVLKHGGVEVVAPFHPAYGIAVRSTDGLRNMDRRVRRSTKAAQMPVDDTDAVLRGARTSRN